MHQEWRVPEAPRWRERRRQLARIADSFRVCTVTIEAPLGGAMGWQEELIQRLLREEAAIRRAVERYQIRSELLKNRGEIRFVEHLYHTPQSMLDTTPKEIGFRITGDGNLVLNQSLMNTGQMLRVLRDNLKRMETFRRMHDDALKELEYLSRRMPLDFSVDTEWKLREIHLASALERFARTIKENEAEVAAFLSSLLQTNPSPSTSSGMGSPSIPSKDFAMKKRMVWVISDRFNTLPSGVIFIPYNVSFDSIKNMLLARK
ncbi:unnamed protein product [Phytomonas sp. EM1]|nr:unnamed protein product [Phytomonas sp. EM1]|eukprot:CCW62558.1 unnamed protein product [Phytomonas sp. isolate EM1]